VNDWAVYWSPEAREDLREIVEFLTRRGDAVNAVRIFDRLVARADSLAHSPKRGRKVPEFRLRADPPPLEIIERPWRIMYVCVHERRRVVIAAVVDGRRNVAAVLQERFRLGLASLP
jgi:plasmid stabilization system protein ParE